MHGDIHIPETARRWLVEGERGISSAAIWSRMTGLQIHRWMWTPSDPDDMRRCRLLLEAVPEWQPRLGEMADVSPRWAALVARWDEVCALMDKEAPRWRHGEGSGPVTYDLMKQIERQADNG